ncbi:Bax inhibitor-1/YccA family protein [Streptomyces sp. BBFR51]|uniref:Bax inhibitor-1/YccA family protein n=1 Tax=Streptomyces sp. BBFR51 TaxID=3372856 RepID=UPI0037DCD07C
MPRAPRRAISRHTFVEKAHGSTYDKGGIDVTPVETRSLKSSNPVLSRRVLGRYGGRKTAARSPLVETAARTPLVEVPVSQDLVPPAEGTDQARKADPALPPYHVADLLMMGHVLARTAVAFALTALTAVLSWLVPPLASVNTAVSYGIAGGAGLTATALVFVQCRRRRSSPVLTLAFALVQGVFLGVLSNTVSTHVSPGIFVQFVMGTMAGFAGVLGAHALRWIRVTGRTWGFLTAAALGLNLLIAADLLLSAATGTAPGFQYLLLGAVVGVTGLAAGTGFLALHLRRVEHEITRGTPRTQSWHAAFGLTLTLTWLYVESLRLLSLATPDDVC